MRMTRHKKQILELYKPEYRDWVRVEAGDPPWICPYISRHLLSLNPLQARCRRYSRGER